MKLFHNNEILYVSSCSTGFLEVPNGISLNIYASGCFKRCKNCQNKVLWAFKRENPVDETAFLRLLEQYSLSDWVCFLGGEPMAQPNAVVALSRAAKRMGRRVCVYTGLDFEELQGVDLSSVDVVVDGEYREELGGVHSEQTNQRVFVNRGGVWMTCRFEELTELCSESGRRRPESVGHELLCESQF